MSRNETIMTKKTMIPTKNRRKHHERNFTSRFSQTTSEGSGAWRILNRLPWNRFLLLKQMHRLYHLWAFQKFTVVAICSKVTNAPHTGKSFIDRRFGCLDPIFWFKTNNHCLYLAIPESSTVLSFASFQISLILIFDVNFSFFLNSLSELPNLRQRTTSYTMPYCSKWNFSSAFWHILGTFCI